ASMGRVISPWKAVCDLLARVLEFGNDDLGGLIDAGGCQGTSKQRYWYQGPVPKEERRQMFSTVFAYLPKAAVDTNIEAYAIGHGNAYPNATIKPQTRRIQ